MLRARIQKALGSFRLDVDIKADGGVLGLLGASGCGKSMTLKCIAGIQRPDRGFIELDGRVLFDSQRRIDVPPRQRRVGYLFQSYALFPNMTVEQNISAGLRCRRDERPRRVEEKIAAFHLQGLEKKRPPELSGGQQQRVALARLLASEPQLILLDEPFSALDSHLKWKLEQQLMDTLAGYGGQTLLVSHNRDEIYRLCARTAVFAEGHVDVCGDTAALFENPATLNGALLTGCKNISRARRLGEHRLLAVDWGVALHTAQPVGLDITHVGIRAHHIHIQVRPTKGGETPEAPEAPNALAATLCREVGSPFSAIVIARSPDAPEGESGYLRCELRPQDWQAVRSSHLTLVLPPERLLLLRS